MKEFSEEVKVEVEMKARRIAYNIEAQGIDLKRRGDKFFGDKDIKFDDEQVNIRITLKGQEGQSYEVTTKLNSIEKVIKGKLTKNGVSHAEADYPLSDFNLPKSES